MCNEEKISGQERGRKNVLLAIDPGNEQSAYVFVDIDTHMPLWFAKKNNAEAMQDILDYIRESRQTGFADIKAAAIEMVASYGMAVGASVFQTCVQIGRFAERLEQIGCHIDYIYRKDEKMRICGQMKAKDSNIRQALIDKYAKFDFKNGKGTKENPDWFYGFRADVWQSYAVGITWIDMRADAQATGREGI